MDTESVEYRLLRNQMVIMSALKNIVSDDNIKGLLDDNIKPTTDCLKIIKGKIKNRSEF